MPDFFLGLTPPATALSQSEATISILPSPPSLADLVLGVFVGEFFALLLPDPARVGEAGRLLLVVRLADFVALTAGECRFRPLTETKGERGGVRVLDDMLATGDK